jgi:hypothetical protein
MEPPDAVYRVWGPRLLRCRASRNDARRRLIPSEALTAGLLIHGALVSESALAKSLISELTFAEPLVAEVVVREPALSESPIPELVIVKSTIAELVVGELTLFESLVSEFALAEPLIAKLIVGEPASFKALVREFAFPKALVAEFISASLPEFPAFLPLAAFTEGACAGLESSFSTHLSRCLRLESPGCLPGTLRAGAAMSSAGSSHAARRTAGTARAAATSGCCQNRMTDGALSGPCRLDLRMSRAGIGADFTHPGRRRRYALSKGRGGG